MKKAVIIGGGVSGLFSAYLLAKSNKYEVHIVEKTDKLGGLLKSFDYGEYGHFDYGAHNILELGIKEIDDFFYNLLPQDEWQITTTINGQIRALTGLLYNKKLQTNSPFIDIRENKNIKEYIGDFFNNLNNTNYEAKNINKLDAYSYSIYLFGEKITNEIITPALKKLYGRGIHPKELNSMVLFLTQFTRIVLFEEHLMEELVDCKKIGSRLSYTEQLNLPSKHLVHLRSLYPSKFGIYRVIDAIEKKLKDMNVIFHFNSTISEINYNNHSIESITINNENLKIDNLISSVGLYPLSQMLNLEHSNNYKFDSNPKTVITNLLIDKKLNCDELSFIYSYDKNSSIFRVDNYINYCNGAIRNNKYPITIESLHFGEINKNKLEDKLINELIEYNLISKETKISFIKTEILDYGFPLLTQNNINIVNELRENIKKLNLSNLTTIGILSEEGLFFESQVIKDTYLKIKELL